MMKKCIALMSACGLFALTSHIAPGATAFKVPSATGAIHTGGPSGGADFYAQGNGNNNFAEYGIASFTFSKADFGFQPEDPIDSITTITLTLTHNDRSFSAAGANGTVEFFLTTDAFAGSYDALAFNGSNLNGIDPANFTSAPVSLGTGAYEPKAGGETDTYTLQLNGAAADLIAKISAGEEFSIILAATSEDTSATFSGLGNTFDPGDPKLTIEVAGAADTQVPEFTGLSPEDDTSKVSIDSDLSVSFNEPVELGEGTITIHNATDDSEIIAIDVSNDDSVSLEDGTLTIELADLLPGNTELYVTIAEGVVADLAGNAFPGLDDKEAWTFSTAPEPFVLNTSEVHVFDSVKTGSTIADIDAVANGLSADEGLSYALEIAATGSSMAFGKDGYFVEPLHTIGESIGDYTPPGILDGLGAYELNETTVRVLANHELLHFRGYPYEIRFGSNGSFTLTGARVSYFDIDKATRQIVASGLAYDTIYDANGDFATDAEFLAHNLQGFSRFCSSQLMEPHQFGEGRGLEDRIYFTGEEDGGFFNPVGGALWALDTAKNDLWHVPALGRGAWESVTEIDTGTTTHVALILADDSSPFDFNPDAEDGREASPLYLYLGEKNPTGDFLERNGLRGGKLFVWVPNGPERTPLDFRDTGALTGKWVEVDNSPTPDKSDESGVHGFDEYGYPTQGNLWVQARALGSFGFSRPEDVSTNPNNGTEIVLASTGVDTYAVDETTGNGADTFGTLYTVVTDFSDLGAPTATVTILYDGDADPERKLRSPDNLDWADNGFIYVQEDEAEEDTLSGDEVLFGPGAANPNEASIVKIDPTTKEVTCIATVDRSVILDPTTSSEAVDTDAGRAGEWESSGILDVSTLFGEEAGTLFLFDVQAHGIEDQSDTNPSSRINDSDLVEGGQLSFLSKAPPVSPFAINEETGEITVVNQDLLDPSISKVTLRITASSETHSTTFTTTVEIEHDVAPVVEASGPFGMIETAQAGTIVGDVDANDGNSDRKDVRFSIADENSPFAIDTATGIITFGRGPVFTLRNTDPKPYGLVEVGSFSHSDEFDAGASEISTYDPATKKLFVVNGEAGGLDVLDLTDPANPLKRWDTLTVGGGEVTSAAVFGDIVAVVASLGDGVNGSISFFRTTTLVQLGETIEVGPTPDMVTFTPDGSKILIAHEGEPDYEGGVDAEGSIGIFAPTGGVTPFGVSALTADDLKIAGFNAFDDQKAALQAAGVRIIGDPDETEGFTAEDTSVSEDLEPEFITVAPDSSRAWITLQENNALALLDLTTDTITGIVPLGFKDHSLPGQGLDGSDKDDAINITSHPVKGMYMADAITNYQAGGQTYLVMANEGDDRGEDERIEDLDLDPDAFPDAEAIQESEASGRLKVSRLDGDTDGDGDYDELFSFGARSFTIRDTEGNIVFDSGDMIEQLTGTLIPLNFNSDNDDPEFDGKSDSQGPEPEGIAVGQVNGSTLAFVGLEDVGGVLVFDITDPHNVTFQSYLNDRDFGADSLDDYSNSNTAPEGLTFISAADSPSGNPLLVVSYEVTSTTGIYEITKVDRPVLDAVAGATLNINVEVSDGVFTTLVPVTVSVEIDDIPVAEQVGPFVVLDTAENGDPVGDVDFTDGDGGGADENLTYSLNLLATGHSMAYGRNGWFVDSIHTIGQDVGDYTPPGILDGLGAYELDENTVRVIANHELLHFRGYPYELSDGDGGTYTLTGARLSYFDINKSTREVVASGVAYDKVYDANGEIAKDGSFLAHDLRGFSRFCSSQLMEAHQFGEGRGLEDRIYFTGEEDGGFFNPVGGGLWALDTAKGEFWHLPSLGRGAWESVTEINSGSNDYVALILADDSSPFDFNPDAEDGREAAPLYLYLGKKKADGNFIERNGLSGGTLYAWIPDGDERTPLDFNGTGTLTGKWVALNTELKPDLADESGANGYDEFGYPTQGNLWIQARALGSFGFSRPEDVSTNPADGTEIVLASTGVDTYAVDETTGNGADTFGTLYTVKTNLSDMSAPTATVTILYDGDADPARRLRSPDNLEWADDGNIYVQEDEAEEDTLSGDEVLFGPGAANPDEASIVKLDPTTGDMVPVATVNRFALLDPTIEHSDCAIDVDAGRAGEWETSGIIDVSSLFGEDPGTLFLFDVQAHGIEDQDDYNPSSRIHDGDLVEGGQLNFLSKGAPANPFTIDPKTGVIRVADMDQLDPNSGDVTLQVIASDGHNESSSVVTIKIGNSLPEVEAPGLLATGDTLAPGVVVGDINANDGNGGEVDENVTYSLGVGATGDSMAFGQNGYHVDPLFTVGESIGDYTPPGVLDGMGAFELNETTVRVLANHEILHFRGYPYIVKDGDGGSFAMTGARISYFDIDKETRKIVASGLAYDSVYDGNGEIANDISFQAHTLGGFSRFCSSQLMEAHQFGEGRGLESRIYFTGEEDGGFFNPVGGAVWALDITNNELWHVPSLGRGAWESVTEVDTGTTTHVALILADDSSPFDFNPDAEDGREAAPLYLYVGEKNADGNFLEQNGLSGGKLYVWVSDSADRTPLDWRASGSRSGTWVEVDNSPNIDLGDNSGANGFDEYGYPTQGNLWVQARALGAFGFSRPEDVSTNPADGTVAVLASTGVDTYAVDPISGNGADTFGTIYTIATDFSDMSALTATITIIYDGDADISRALRSPDNLDWADDGFIYIQEDEAEEDTLSGDEILFGPEALNPNEASIVQLNPETGKVITIATIDRSVVLDPTTSGTPVDTDLGRAGEWESSGILDVSTLFGEEPGSLFIFNVQAHGIEDQSDTNADSRIHDGDLVEGGQLSFLSLGAPENPFAIDPETGVITVADSSLLNSSDGAITLSVKVTDAFGSTIVPVVIDIQAAEEIPSTEAALRVATFNVSLNRNSAGQLLEDLETKTNGQAKAIAEMIQLADADVILLNEFDYDDEGKAIESFLKNYLEVSQNGLDPVVYPYVFNGASNTGVPSGKDLDNNGSVGGPGDAYGFGFHEGQFGMVLLSKYPIARSDIRTFQTFLWKDMPGALLPPDPNDTDGDGDLSSYYNEEELEVFRLSSKSHWDIPVSVNGEVVHILASHPTPPVFDDGTETDLNNPTRADWNGLRNHDEIRFWADYVDPLASGYIYDDNGRKGGLKRKERFVILGDQNADPVDGDSSFAAIDQLLDSPYVDTSITPTSDGGAEFVTANAPNNSEPGSKTATFNLRADYVLPSVCGLVPVQGAVYWPVASDHRSSLLGATDHRLVYVDLDINEMAHPGGSNRHGAFDESAAEIVTFCSISERLFVSNADHGTVDVLDASDPENLVQVAAIPVGEVNHVRAKNGVLAAAVGNDDKQLPGTVQFFDTISLSKLSEVTVGVLPDMLIFSPDGTTVLTANEGEPNDDYTVDPLGSMSFVDIGSGSVADVAAVTQDDVHTIDMTAFSATPFLDHIVKAGLRSQGARFFGQIQDEEGEFLRESTLAEDIEPEYIAIAPDGSEAYVVCQENNMIVVINMASRVIDRAFGLGVKDHSIEGNGFDASNKDDAINIRTWPVYGYYMPDAIDAFEVDGKTYLITANEGDSRDYDGYSEEERMADLELDPTVFPDAEELLKPENLGRLKTTTANGDIDGDGDFDELYSYGTRSFTIWDTNGNVVYDSGDQLERIVAARFPEGFNASNDENGFDDRSDDKGPEPEALTTGYVNGRLYAFVSLERVSGIVIFDITDPTTPMCIDYLSNRDFTVEFSDDPTEAEIEAIGDLGPEGLHFISNEDSPNGSNLLAVANEVSGTTTVWNLDNVLNGKFTLQVLHSSDNESKFQDPNTGEVKILGYSAVVEGLRQVAANEDIPSVHLTAGDHTLPGPFYQASSEVEAFQQPGLADIAFYNAMQVAANGIGNHEFDGGIDEFAHMLSRANYPFVAANLDFSHVQLKDGSPAIEIGIDGASAEENAGKVVRSCYLTVGGERIGFIGRAPADFFNVIEDPDTNLPGLDFFGGRGANNQPNISAVGQVLEQVALLESKGINKIILIDHAQDFTADPLSANSLRGIDIIVAAGSTGFMAQDSAAGPFNLLRDGDEPEADYPTVRTDSEGGTVLVVNSDQLYTYVGNLIVGFDKFGRLCEIDDRSGPVTTGQAGIDALSALLREPVEPNAEVESVWELLSETDSIQESFAFIGKTEGELVGARAEVRSRETNLGRLAADSTLWFARKFAAESLEDEEAENDVPFAIDIALKNGGGIRSTILGPDIRRLAIEEALAFNNKLSLLQLTAAELLASMENAVSRYPALDGRFPQIAGMMLVFDPSAEGIQAGTSSTTPSRIRELAVQRVDGELDVIVAEGAFVGDPERTFGLATNSFLLTGGDGYTAFRTIRDDENRATFQTELGEQKILEQYIQSEFTDACVDIVEPLESARVSVHDRVARYLAWIEGFVAPDTKNCGINEDLNGDGRDNFFSYAFNADPRQFSNGNLPSVASDANGIPTLSFTLNDDPSLLWELEISNDGETWTKAEAGTDYTLESQKASEGEVSYSLSLIITNPTRLYRVSVE